MNNPVILYYAVRIGILVLILAGAAAGALFLIQQRRWQSHRSALEHELAECRKSYYQKLYGYFQRTVAHEYGKGFDYILNKSSETLEGLGKDQTALREKQNGIISKTHEMNQHAMNILHVFNIETVQLNNELLNIRQLIESVLLELFSYADSLGVIFRPELSDFEPIILDRDLTVLAIRNVVHNAIKYSYRAGVVEIFLTVEEDVAGTGRTIVIRVKDHGRGIKDSEKEKIFEPFMRGDGLIQTGNGLGLYCARMAARLQSGELILESSSPEGSVFQLRLPYARAGEAIHDVKADMPKKSPINRNWVLAMTGLLGFSFLTYLIFGPFGGSPPPPPMPTIEPTLMQATLTAEPTSYPKISLVSAHGQFVTALGEGDDWLVKQEPGLTECGVFDFIYLGDDTVALRTCYNRYITAPRMANNQPVPPHKEQFQLWQDSAMGDCGKFKVLDLDGYFIALKTCAGMVVTAGDGNWDPPMEWAVVAETDQVSSWEKFTQGTQP